MTDVDPMPGTVGGAKSREPDPGHGSMNKHAISGALWSVLQSSGGRVVSMVVFVALGRLLDVKDFGLVSLASIFVELGSLLTVSGFHRALVQRSEVEDEHLDAAFWSSTAIGVALCLGLVACADLIADGLGEPDFANVLRVLSIAFVLNGIGAVPTAILHRRMQFRAFAVRQLLAIFLGGAIAITLAAAGAGPWALVAQSLTSAVVGLVVVALNARWRPRLRFSARHWRDLARFGVLSMVIDLTDVANARLDDLLIGVVLGTQALGLYGVAYRTFAIALEVVAYSLGAVSFPIFSRIGGDVERAGRGIVTATRFTAAAILPVFLGLAVLADNAVIGLFGEQWRSSVPVLRILCLSAAAGAGVMLVREVVLAVGRPRMEIVKTAFGTTVTVTGFAIAVHWGIVGVAWSRLVAALVVVPFEVFIMYRVLRFDLRGYAVACLRPLPACAIMVAVVWGLKSTFHPDPSSIPWLLALTAGGGLVYVGALTVTARSTVDELLGRVRNRHA